MKVCTKCIAQFGFKLSDSGKTFNTDDEYADHMENIHGMVVIRNGETEEDATKRCAEKGIVSDRTKCICEECKILRKEQTFIRIADRDIALKWLR